MGTKRFNSCRAVTRWVIAVIAVLLLGVAAPSYAGISGSIPPNFPDTVTVGATNVPVSVLISPDADSEGAPVVTLNAIKLTPSCGEKVTTGICPTGEEDPGVFALVGPYTGALDCTGYTFLVSVADATTGEVLFTPTATLTLTARDLSVGEPGQNCRINFKVDVLKLPGIGKDSNSGLAGLQTAQLTSFTASTPTLLGGAQGSDETTVRGCGDGVVESVLYETCDPPGVPVCPINNPGCAEGDKRICRSNCTYCGDDAATVGPPPGTAKGLDRIPSDCNPLANLTNSDCEYCDDGDTNNADECNNLCKPNCDSLTQTSSSQKDWVDPLTTTKVKDTATVTSPLCPTLGTPTGTVDFSLCHVSTDPTIDRPAGCGELAVTLKCDNVTVSGGTAECEISTPTDAGWWCWRADFTATAGGLWPDSSEKLDGVNECFRIGKPKCEVQKSVTPTVTKAGDSLTYKLGPLCNTGQTTLTSATCTDQKNNGDPVFNCAAAVAHCFPLAPGACCDSATLPFYTEPSYTVKASDPDPLKNHLALECADGAGQKASCSADAEVDLVHPKFTANKTCSPATLAVGDTISWDIVLNNTSGDVALNVCCTDATAGIDNECHILPATGETSYTIHAERVITADDECKDITNTATCTATLEGFPNIIPPDAANSDLTATCRVPCIETGCRMTGGHVNMAGDVDAGFTSDSGTKYTTGGQIGAPNESGCREYPQKGKCELETAVTDACTTGLLCSGGARGGECCDPAMGTDPEVGCPNDMGHNSSGPWGDWQHNHHKGPDDGNITDGSFSFHSGTAAAPDEAYIKNIICADPGWCVNARPAPDKQIFWEGTGVFHNLKGARGSQLALPDFPVSLECPAGSVKVWDRKTGGSLHYYKAHVGDFGEPAGQRQKPVTEACVENGFGDPWTIDCDGVAQPEPDTVNELPIIGVNWKVDMFRDSCQPQDCTECPDWYEIEIHCTTDPESPVIYKVGHFILEGNFQLHPPVGESCANCGDGFCEEGPVVWEDCTTCEKDCGACPPTVVY